MNTSNESSIRTFLDLTIEQHPGGDWNLKQDGSPFDGTDIHWIILAPEQLDTLARMAGFVPVAEIVRACERLKDRLHLLAGMVEAHTRQGDPLRAAVAAIVPEYERPTQAHAINLIAGTNQIDCAALRGKSAVAPTGRESETGQIPLLDENQ